MSDKRGAAQDLEERSRRVVVKPVLPVRTSSVPPPTCWTAPTRRLCIPQEEPRVFPKATKGEFCTAVASYSVAKMGAQGWKFVFFAGKASTLGRKGGSRKGKNGSRKHKRGRRRDGNSSDSEYGFDSRRGSSGSNASLGEIGRDIFSSASLHEPERQERRPSVGGWGRSSPAPTMVKEGFVMPAKSKSALEPRPPPLSLPPHNGPSSQRKSRSTKDSKLTR